MSYNLSNLSGNWYCEEHNLKISIEKENESNNLCIEYQNDELNKPGIESTAIKIIDNIIGIKCRLGNFTVYFDGKNLLHFLAYFANEDSYVFERDLVNEY